MRITVVAGNRLTAGQLRAWSDVQRADPRLDSPMFHPKWTGALAEVCTGVEVAVLDEAGEPASFFPFERDRWNVGRPVGWRVSDLHGIVGRAGVSGDPVALLRACGLVKWQFGCVPASQQAFEPHHSVRAALPYVDLRHGWETYRLERRRSGSSVITEVLRKARKIEREVGPLRLAWDTADPTALGALIEWKSRQFARTGHANLFHHESVIRLITRLRERASAEFGGMVTTLWCGDELIAGHVGVRSRSVLTWWIPTYNPKYARYSPGLILLVRMAQAGPHVGFRRIDLGAGPERYKRQLASGCVPVAAGTVDPSRLRRALRRGWSGRRARIQHWVHDSPLRGRPLRTFRQARDWLRWRRHEPA